MTTTRTSHLLLAALLGGCYQGLDSPRAMGDGDDAAGDGVDDGLDDGEPQRIPTDAPPGFENPFEVPQDEVELLPFYVRAQNLATLAGQPPEHPMFAELYARRYQLGDHNYANNVAPDLRWSAQKMETWVVALKPVCDDPTFQAKWPTLVNDPTPFLRAAYAREPNSDELQALADVQSGLTDTAVRYRMVCLAALTSLEFVAR
ncbi:MAG TPA: hypothetical protein VFG69_06255 [Nannocystaceae bacterium]|nr:hypothetical protein [Nannocystaceae bacterium]